MTPLPAGHLARVTELCRRHRVARLAVFGSVTTAAFDPASSDLDFLVSFAPMSPAEHADAYFGLLDGLEALFGREIDLIEEEAIENPLFRRATEASRILLYAA